MTKDEAQQLADVARALWSCGPDAVSDAIAVAWQRGRRAGLTEAAQVGRAQARTLRQAADSDEGSRDNLNRKAFAVEQVVRQIEARQVSVHFAYRGKDPARDYFACDAEVAGTASTGEWEQVTCPDCLAFRARCPR